MRTLLVSLDTAGPLLALIAGVLLLKRPFNTKEIKWLLLYLLCGFLFNGAANIISEWYEVNNHILYHIENLLNFILLSAFFSRLPLFEKYRRVFIYVVLFFVLANFSYKVAAGNYHTFDSFGFAWCSIMFTVYSLWYYSEMLQSQKGESLFSIPSFWFVTGILIYYASCFFIFILYRHYTTMQNTAIGLLWRFQNVMLMIMSIFIVKGFVCQASHKSP